jgi:hypothetical protein
MPDPYSSNITADSAAAFDRSMPPANMNMATRVRALRTDLDASRVTVTLDIAGGSAAGQAGVLNATPKTIVAAVPGSTIIVESVTATLTHNGATYDGTGTFALEFDSGAAITTVIPFADLGGASGNAVRISGPAMPYEPSSGAAVIVKTSADWYSGTGDGDLSVKLSYRLSADA